MWNIYRVENEHLNNCGEYRAVQDIPLPFESAVSFDEQLSPIEGI